MATLKENIDPIKNPWTTIPGMILFVVGALLWVLPYFMDLKKSVEWYQWAVPMGLGIILWVAPDKIISIALGFFQRKADSI